MIKHTIIALFIGLLIFSLYLAQHLGAFKKVNIGLENRESIHLVGKNHFGSYHKIVPVIEEVEKWFKENTLDCTHSFGEYIDNPNSIEEGRLRSIGGCIISKKDYENINEWKDKLPEGYFIKELPAQRFVVATFEGGPSIGPFKVYPKVQDFSQDNQIPLLGPNLEVYEILAKNKMITTYLFYIKNEMSAR